MNTNPSIKSHEEISRRARIIWQNYGEPSGRDIEIWYEAERQIAAGAPVAKMDSASQKPPAPASESKKAAESAEQITAETAAESVVEYHISPAIPDREAVQAALQKNEARAPKVSHSAAPKRAPTESGKPLWNKPHSS